MVHHLQTAHLKEWIEYNVVVVCILSIIDTITVKYCIKKYFIISPLIAYIIKTRFPSLLSLTYSTSHPWPRKETELSYIAQAYLITQHSGTSKIPKGDGTVHTVQT